MRALTVSMLLVCIFASVAFAGPRHGSRRSGSKTATAIAALILLAVVASSDRSGDCNSYSGGYYAPQSYSGGNYPIQSCNYSYPTVGEYKNGHFVVTYPYAPGTRLQVIEQPNPYRRTRERKGALLVEKSDGLISWARVLDGGANSGDIVVPQ